ncbi:MAG: sugar phosphate isomerase/epimerase [Acetobacteraceae bacterium]|nr:sugar phosphate isomerase/epimerase [Acetobacteraceae bacterium]
MKLAVSNIAWSVAEQDAILAALPELGVTGVEIAPTVLWPDWEGATPSAARALRTRLAGQGLAVPALQSILFARPALQLFGDAASQEALVAHIAATAALAAALGAGVMVFGSPRNRLRGDLPPAAAMDQAVPLLRVLGAACRDAGTTLGIEANPAQYGGDFVLRWSEAAALVDRVNHPGVVLHLDTACTALAGDDPAAAAAACASRIRHFHVSASQLGPVDAASPIDHPAIAAALHAGGYAGWVSIEMRRTDTPLETVRAAAAHVRACYATTP